MVRAALGARLLPGPATDCACARASLCSTALRTTFDVDVVALADEFITVAHPQHGVPRAAYFGALRKVLGPDAEDPHNKVLLGQVFETVMDQESRCAPLRALVSSISVLCAEADQHGAAMFAVYDEDQGNSR